jgi:hypothetical protein
MLSIRHKNIFEIKAKVSELRADSPCDRSNWLKAESEKNYDKLNINAV